VPVRIAGSVSSISESGNLVTDITAKQLDGAPRDEQVSVRCDDHVTNGLFEVGHEQPAMTLIALVGESRYLEMEIVGDSARIMLGVSVGQKVEVSW
jgi:S-adenosylmethionine hydrolase